MGPLKGQGPKAGLLIAVLFFCELCLATTWHINPTAGNSHNKGTEASPWQTLEHAIKTGKLELVAPGDTILLYSGHHGTISLSGENTNYITIAGADKHTATFSRLRITHGSNWKIQNISISPSYATEKYKGSIVNLGDKNNTSKVIIEGCEVFTSRDTSTWTIKNWMEANSGIWLGRKGGGLIAKNNYVFNVRHGIELCSVGDICEGNIVKYFSGDAIRAMNHNQLVAYNVIKNSMGSQKAGDPNHDDGIQCFLFNLGVGEIKNIKIIGNYILHQENDKHPFKSHMQGLAAFDGPNVDFEVSHNIVNVDHWHGISLYYSKNCRISNNIVYSTWATQKRKPWIQLGKKKHAPNGNFVLNNKSPDYQLTEDSNVQSEGNTSIDKTTFDVALSALLKLHQEKYDKQYFYPKEEGR